MRKHNIISVLAFCIVTPVIAAEKPDSLKRGDSLFDHMGVLDKYGKCEEAFPEIDIDSIDSASPKCMYKIGAGYLIIEFSMSAGTIRSMTYVFFSDENRKQHIKLKVKAIDLIKSEMTISLQDDDQKNIPDGKMRIVRPHK